ncbi:MAG: metalloregulator ArsR/SmtB family transcription factor [Nitrososphaerales archaeon]|nr:metalloregulator ArsR/SmtB family transcription factor [Nitrososphaerales archaeon]
MIPKMLTVRIVREGEACEVRCLNPLRVKALLKSMPSGDDLAQLSDVFQVMSDSNRLKVLHCLSEGEVCVCDLSAVLGLSVSGVSHHLRLLRAMRLVTSRREGKNVYYSLDDAHITKLMKMALEHERE